MAMELIGPIEIARLAGSGDRNFASRKVRTDPTFPKPVIQAVTGKSMAQWERAAVAEWLGNFSRRPTDKSGRVIEGPGHKAPLDNTLSVRFLSGYFDRPARLRRNLARRMKARAKTPATHTVHLQEQ